MLGPLLTLIVYRAGKPGLRFDLTVIGVVQASCLAVGVWIVHGERPLAIVYVDGSFYSVTAQSFREIDVPVPDLDATARAAIRSGSRSNLPRDYENNRPCAAKCWRSGRMLSTLSDRYIAFDPDMIDNSEARETSEVTDQDRDAQSLTNVGRRRMAERPTTIASFRSARDTCIRYLGFDTKERSVRRLSRHARATLGRSDSSAVAARSG